MQHQVFTCEAALVAREIVLHGIKSATVHLVGIVIELIQGCPSNPAYTFDAHSTALVMCVQGLSSTARVTERNRKNETSFNS